MFKAKSFKRIFFFFGCLNKLSIYLKIIFMHKNNSKLFSMFYNLISDLINYKRVDLITKKKFSFKKNIFESINFKRKFFIGRNIKNFYSKLQKKLNKLKRNKRYKHYTYLVYGRRKRMYKYKRQLYKTLKHYRKSYIRYKKRLKYEKKHKKKVIIHFKPSYSNYFITLTDLSYKIIKNYSGGLFCASNNKKQKMSPVLCRNILRHMYVYLKFYKVKIIKFEIKTRMDSFFYQSLRFFKARKFKIESFSLVKRMPHNLGQRKRKIRRV